MQTLSERAGIHGHVHSFRTILNLFLGGLDRMEGTGLPQPVGSSERECQRVRTVLVGITQLVMDQNRNNIMGDYGPAMARLSDAYYEWNQAARGWDGHDARRRALDEMRRAKRDFPLRQGWGADKPLNRTDREFLEELRTLILQLGEVEGPESPENPDGRGKPVKSERAFPQIYEKAKRG